MNEKIINRFWAKVDKDGANGCWIWQGAKKRYGTFAGKKAHRLSWELTNGRIPSGLLVCHHCDNPICVNPKHLFLGTHKENSADAIKKGRMGKGEKSATPKLNNKKVLEIKQLRSDGFSVKQIAQKYQVTNPTIYNILKGRTWFEAK